MKFTSWVIIACPELSDEFKFLGDLTGRNGNDVEDVDVYACGTENADSIASFMESLINKWEAENEKKDEEMSKNIEWHKKFLEAVKNDVYQHQMPKNLKLGIIEQVRRSFSESWKYIPKLNEDERYLYLSTVDVRTIPPMR